MLCLFYKLHTGFNFTIHFLSQDTSNEALPNIARFNLHSTNSSNVEGVLPKESYFCDEINVNARPPKTVAMLSPLLEDGIFPLKRGVSKEDLVNDHLGKNSSIGPPPSSSAHSANSPFQLRLSPGGINHSSFSSSFDELVTGKYDSSGDSSPESKAQHVRAYSVFLLAALFIIILFQVNNATIHDFISERGIPLSLMTSKPLKSFSFNEKIKVRKRMFRLFNFSV